MWVLDFSDGTVHKNDVSEIFWDDDYQHDPAEITNLIDKPLDYVEPPPKPKPQPIPQSLPVSQSSQNHLGNLNMPLNQNNQNDNQNNNGPFVPFSGVGHVLGGKDD